MALCLDTLLAVEAFVSLARAILASLNFEAHARCRVAAIDPSDSGFV